MGNEPMGDDIVRRLELHLPPDAREVAENRKLRIRPNSLGPDGRFAGLLLQLGDVPGFVDGVRRLGRSIKLCPGERALRRRSGALDDVEVLPDAFPCPIALGDFTPTEVEQLSRLPSVDLVESAREFRAKAGFTDEDEAEDNE